MKENIAAISSDHELMKNKLTEIQSLLANHNVMQINSSVTPPRTAVPSTVRPIVPCNGNPETSTRKLQNIRMTDEPSRLRADHTARLPRVNYRATSGRRNRVPSYGRRRNSGGPPPQGMDARIATRPRRTHGPDAFYKKRGVSVTS